MPTCVCHAFDVWGFTDILYTCDILGHFPCACYAMHITRPPFGSCLYPWIAAHVLAREQTMRTELRSAFIGGRCACPHDDTDILTFILLITLSRVLFCPDLSLFPFRPSLFPCFLYICSSARSYHILFSSFLWFSQSS
jgi:hypothetical protein